MKIRLQSDKRAELILNLSRGPVTIGRDAPVNTFAIEHSQVSRTHAQLVLKDGKAIVEDLGSTNGVYVTGMRINEPVVIEAGIPFRLGHSGPRIWFDVIDTDEPVPPTNEPTGEASAQSEKTAQPQKAKKSDDLPPLPSDPGVMIKLPTGVYELAPDEPLACSQTPTDQQALPTMQVQAAPSATELNKKDTKAQSPLPPEPEASAPAVPTADKPPSPLRMLLPLLLLCALIGGILISMKMLEQDDAGKIEELGPGESAIDFGASIAPILQSRCIECHGADEQKGKLRLDSRGAALAGSRNGRVITRGSAAESPLYQRVILGVGDDDLMPNEGEPLTNEQTDLIRRWINQGAVWPDSHRKLQ